jgi:hypothetical protein
MLMYRQTEAAADTCVQLAPWTVAGLPESAPVAAVDPASSLDEMLGITHAGVRSGAARSAATGSKASRARMFPG